MPKKATPARRRAPSTATPKALVLKGKKHTVIQPPQGEDGTPMLPPPKGVAHSPVRSLTEEQMDGERRERGAIAELQHTRKDA